MRTDVPVGRRGLWVSYECFDTRKRGGQEPVLWFFLAVKLGMLVPETLVIMMRK